MNFIPLQELKDIPYFEYYESMAKPNNDIVIKVGFIDWSNDDPDRWAGPIEGKYAFIRLEQETNDLKTIKELEEEMMEYERTSKYNYPYKYTKDIDFLVYVGDTACDRSELTEEEISNIRSQMSEEELISLDKKIQEEYEDLMYEVRHAQAHVEKPFKIYMCGNDDASYSALFSTKEEAMNAFDNISKYPTWETLKKFNFIFTN